MTKLIKKTILLGMTILVILSVPITSSAQTQIEKHNILFDQYYGFPSFQVAFTSILEDNGMNDINITGIGPAGLRLEYMLSDKFGLGLDFIYKGFRGTATFDSLKTDSTLYKSYSADVAMHRYRIHIRANYHFVQSTDMDTYIGFGVGINYRNVRISTIDPDIKRISISAAGLPVSFRLALGSRYYFTENLGVMGELGLGGPLVSVGFSLKF